ncbi:hypothetical protein FHR99_001766 [Litorivivens lipolytica]|uniref:FHA domain-containing protein n=1 Tax=Litorivivens lipolytica TaxID=1524264 RepID=A0A7W4W4W4_9GAMM|nr:hypothetical protein [Litorivivens lipolytica]MBB3047500.1 hypothetical protein [Litorivivens lipolytica]
MLILDFNDSALRLFGDDGLLASSPACAVLNGDSFLLGSEALAKSRLNPRATYLHFWEQLDQQPLNRLAGSARSHADIAYYHLRHLFQSANTREKDILLLVPAHYGSERLALLLGIVQACSLRVAGIAESAVLAAASVPPSTSGTSIRYLDISQHRSMVTDIECDTRLKTGVSRELTTPGLNWCIEQCVRQISEQFLQETRFDPLHEAASEQRLFDQLPRWWQALQQSSRVTLELPAGLRQHRIEWRREQVEVALDGLYRELQKAVRDASGAVLLSHRLAALPGLTDTLRACGEVHVLTETASVDIARQKQSLLCTEGDSPLWVKQLPLPEGERSEPAMSVPAAPTLKATHVLHEHRAFPIGGGLQWPASEPQFQLQCEGETLRVKPLSERVSLNGDSLVGAQSVSLGDCLQTPAGDVQLIRVESET